MIQVKIHKLYYILFIIADNVDTKPANKAMTSTNSNNNKNSSNFFLLSQ